MTALAAHEIILNVADASGDFETDNTAGDYAANATVAGNIFQVVGAKDITISANGDVLDTTAFSDGSYRTKLVGLIDGSMSFSGNFEAGTGEGTASDFLAKLPAGTQTWFFIGYTTTSAAAKVGLVATGFIESFEITGAVDGLVEYSCSVALTTDASDSNLDSGPAIITQ
jgi:hypothetical protein